MVHRLMSIAGGPRVRTLLVALTALALSSSGRMRSACMLIVATGGMGAINTGIKKAVRRRRPSVLPGRRQAGGYSFPSGHSSGSFVFFGALAYLAWHLTRRVRLGLIAVGIAGVATVLVGYSRVGLRAHHRSDVLAGFALGAVWLAAVLRLFSRPLAGERW